MIRDQQRGNKSGLTDQFIKGTGKIIKDVDLVISNGRMGINILEIGTMIRETVKGLKYSLMGINMMAIGSMI